MSRLNSNAFGSKVYLANRLFLLEIRHMADGKRLGWFGLTAAPLVLC